MREEWYAHYSKALYHTAQYELCAEICKQALENIKVFHYSNDCWLARRMALCLKKMGNTTKAIYSLEKLLKRKREWFILKELSELHLEVEDVDKALNYAKEAMKGYGPLAFKVELIEMLGDLLLNKGDKSLAMKHYLLAKLLRENEKWNVDKHLQDKIKNLDCADYCIINDIKTIENELRVCWNTSIPNDSKQAISKYEINTVGKRIVGKIIKLLPEKENGVDGFLKNESGGSAYFFVPKEHILFKEIKVGFTLEYEITPAKNGKGDKAAKLKKI